MSVPKVSYYLLDCCSTLLGNWVYTYIVKTVGSKEVYPILSALHVRDMARKRTLVLLITRASPEVADLLGLDVTRSKRRTLKRRSRDLQNRQRRGILGQDLSDTRDAGNKRGKRETFSQDSQRRERHESGLHLGLCLMMTDLMLSRFERVFLGLYSRSILQLAVSRISYFPPFSLALGNHLGQARKKVTYHPYCKRNFNITRRLWPNELRHQRQEHEREVGRVREREEERACSFRIRNTGE